MKTIGDRLRSERIRLSLSQTAAAEIGGVKKLAQIKYEQSERAPDATYLSAISSAGFDVLYVLTGTRAPQAIAAQIAFMLREARLQEPEGKGPLHDMLPKVLADMGEHAAQRMPRLEPIIARLSTCTAEDFALVEAMLARIFGDTATPPQK